MADIAKFVDEISNMSVLELSELVKAIEEKFGVTASAPVMMGGVMPAAGGAAQEEAKEEEQTEFNLVLKDFGSQKIKVIKEVRAVTDLGLKEAKTAVESVPTTLKEAISKEDAEKAKEQLEAVGATVEIV